MTGRDRVRRASQGRGTCTRAGAATTADRGVTQRYARPGAPLPRSGSTSSLSSGPRSSTPSHRPRPSSRRRTSTLGEHAVWCGSLDLDTLDRRRARVGFGGRGGGETPPLVSTWPGQGDRQNGGESRRSPALRAATRQYQSSILNPLKSICGNLYDLRLKFDHATIYSRSTSMQSHPGEKITFIIGKGQSSAGGGV